MGEDSRFDRRGDMTSITNWSERTDSTVTLTTTTGLGASPSQVTTGDELIAEKSDLFGKRSAPGTFTRLGPNSSVGKGAGQNSDPIEKQADRSPCCEEPEVENGSGSSLTPASPREEEEMDSSQPAELQDQVVVPEVIKKPRIPPFFVSPKGDWRQLVALAKLIAPSFQSQMSGRFLKVTVGDELEYRNLSHWLEQSGVEFKSFMLKQDRPIKVVIRGLPSNTEPEDIKNEIEAEGFKVVKISQMKNYRSKAPMPLFTFR
ncbi:zinc finger protein [Trichonephila clavipes]|uniref:Zinc finger protein n=1 Tax=Trichonephila clavipes TaxID=2585209 RepID=A0A8X7BFQ7_TRICX|nr:zinc finger protein [Trichonephila clavipes]